MVPYAGWNMPVVYKGLTLSESHLYTRNHAGLFDVSHMGQLMYVFFNLTFNITLNYEIDNKFQKYQINPKIFSK